MYTPDAHDEPIPISIFSYSRLLRDGLPSLLNPHIRIQLIGSYAGEFRPRHDYPNPPCHVVLLDSGIGREDASAWTHWWRQREPAASVLILELEDDKDIIFACIEQGASGYTVKESAPSEVAACIYQASRGAALCSPEMTAYLFARVATLKAAQPPAKPATPLTNRELEVLHCISKGYSNKEIASALHIELHTVKHHVHNILEKLDLRHRHEAARVAADQGWFALSV